MWIALENTPWKQYRYLVHNLRITREACTEIPSNKKQERLLYHFYPDNGLAYVKIRRQSMLRNILEMRQTKSKEYVTN
jgi:hypothetical protein